MTARLKVREKATARDIARLHESVANAVEAVRSVGSLKLGVGASWETVLTSESRDQLLVLLRRLQSMSLSLEGPFDNRVGLNPRAPFSDVDKPRVWMDFLDSLERP